MNLKKNVNLSIPSIPCRFLTPILKLDVLKKNNNEMNN